GARHPISPCPAPPCGSSTPTADNAPSRSAWTVGEMATTTDAATTPATAPARRRLAARDGLLAWGFLLPSVVYIVALVGVPFVLAIAFAFSDVTAGDPS